MYLDVNKQLSLEEEDLVKDLWMGRRIPGNVHYQTTTEKQRAEILQNTEHWLNRSIQCFYRYVIRWKFLGLFGTIINKKDCFI